MRRPSGRRLLGQVEPEPLERAGDFADRVDGDARIERRRFQLGVAEQDLNHPDVDALFKQVGGEAMALIPSSELAPLFRVPDYSE